MYYIILHTQIYKKLPYNVWGALYSIMNQLLFLVLIVVVLYLIGRLTGEDVDEF